MTYGTSPSSQSAYRTAFRLKKLAALPPGTCYTCYKNPIVPGKKQCPLCISRAHDRAQRYYSQVVIQKKIKARYRVRKAKGICVCCSKRKTKPGYVRCAPCLTQAAQDLRRFRAKRTIENLLGYSPGVDAS